MMGVGVYYVGFSVDGCWGFLWCVLHFWVLGSVLLSSFRMGARVCYDGFYIP